MLPLALTTISTTRAKANVDPYKPGPATGDTPVVTGLRAAISSDTGTAQILTGTRVEYTFVLNTDPADLRAGDTVIDDGTGEKYVLLWVRLRAGLGLDHMTGRLRMVTGGR